MEKLEFSKIVSVEQPNICQIVCYKDMVIVFPPSFVLYLLISTPKGMGIVVVKKDDKKAADFHHRLKRNLLS